MGDNPIQKAEWDQGRMKPDTDYRKVVHGIVPGYTGHVPNAIDKHGTTYFGAITKAGEARQMNLSQLYVDDGADSGDGGTHYGAQRGHTNSLLDKCNDVRLPPPPPRPMNTHRPDPPCPQPPTPS